MRRARSLALRSLALAALLTACSGGATESTPLATATSTSTTTAPATPTPTPTAPAALVRMTVPGCGYGGSATAVAVFVDVENDVALHGVTFSMAIANPTTHAVASQSGEPRMTAVSPVDRGLLDFSMQGTTPFDGELAAGARTRLQHFAGAGELPPGVGGPIEVQVTMTTSDGQHFEATCTTEQMWPSS